MGTNRIEDLDNMFDDHPSLSASLEDYEHENRSPTFGLPSQHSGFKSEESDADADGESSSPPFSPPAWKTTSGNRWYRHQPYQQHGSSLRPSASPFKSRESSPQYESAQEEDEDITMPANVPLPRGSVSPLKERSPSPAPYPTENKDFEEPFGGEIQEVPQTPENPNNYIRFAVRAEVQHRTEPFEATFSYLGNTYASLTKSRTSLTTAITVALLSISLLRLLFQTPSSPPVPDLVKVAGLARSFEPLIFYSENGVSQIGDLQETGVAVWDLGESIRTSNMTSAPLIVQELDDLSELLKTLAIELTKFFANVDGDIDGILIVMDWAKRELAALSTVPLSSISSAFTNIHTLLSRLGVLQHPSSGTPTRLGLLLTDLFGATPQQRTKLTLQRTFTEFLAVLEESINSELSYATALFSLFSTIDRQFLNLQRTTIRESDTQERLEGEFLSSLWTRVLGPNASQLRKYEKNRDLLKSVRGKTVQNKNLLVEHNGKLMALKQNLETLRRKLVSPLVRGGEGSTVAVEEQVRGLEATYEHLRRVRERQKGRVLEVLYGVGSRRGMGVGGGAREELGAGSGSKVID